jgi:hypothetical protein
MRDDVNASTAVALTMAEELERRRLRIEALEAQVEELEDQNSRARGAARMTDEKPLHVRVAEALGCTPRAFDGEWFCDCKATSHRFDGGAGRIAEYDSDWSATGPLIERFAIKLDPYHADHWEASAEIPTRDGATPLEAVCSLILALAEAGKLPR